MTDHLGLLRQYLEQAPVVYGYVPQLTAGGGHGNKIAVVLEGGVHALVKPASGAQDGLLAVQNEAAAWELACLLGWGELVAGTVIRDVLPPQSGAPEPAAVQVMWPGYDWTPAPGSFPEGETWKAAILDMLMLHSDRTNNNWLGVPPAQLPFPGPVYGSRQQLKLIDHGFAFDFPGRANLSSSFVDLHRGNPIPADLLQAVGAGLAQVEASPVRAILDDMPFERLKARFEGLLQSGSL